MSKKSMPISNNFCPQTLFLYGAYKEDGTPNFGLFCWASYYWDTDLGFMACIGGEKLTRDRINATKVFSANLVTEEMLPLADWLGNCEGYSSEKENLKLDTQKGEKLNVPILTCSPVAFELEVSQSIQKDDAEVFLCKIRNVLTEEALLDETIGIEERMKTMAPIRTIPGLYFSWTGEKLGSWGEPMKQVDLTK